MEKLIQKLVLEHGPRKVLSRPEVRVWKLAGLGIAFSVFCLAVVGIRSSPISSSELLSFSGEMLLLGGLLLSTLYLVLLSIVPGESLRKACLWSGGFLLAWLFYLSLGVIFGVTPDMPLEGRSCLVTIGLIVTLPMVVLTREARKGISLSARSTGYGIGLSAATIAVLGLEAHCEWESALHHIVFHFLPVVLIAMFSLVLSRYLFPRLKGNPRLGLNSK